MNGQRAEKKGKQDGEKEEERKFVAWKDGGWGMLLTMGSPRVSLSLRLSLAGGTSPGFPRGSAHLPPSSSLPHG